VEPDGFSRPDLLLYETWVEKFRETYVGPIELPWGEIEHKFRYDMELPRIFWQKRGTTYWLNISAVPKQERPWGWESSMDRWNDVAVQGWYDDPANWWWDMLISPAPALTFEDLFPGDTYAVGNTFTTSGIPVSVRPFRLWDGTLYYTGRAIVDYAGQAGGTGNEINTNNVNLDFALPFPVTDVSFLFGEYAGQNNNLAINGNMVNFKKYHDIDGMTIGGVHVSVAGGFGNDTGIVKLSGRVNQLAVGGQEHFIDDVTFSKFLDMSFELTTCEGPIKWLQFPDMANGVNIISSIEHPTVADDFVCTNGRPITEVHFWGSFLDREGRHWAQDVPIPPAQSPRVDKFKLSFHRDIPAGVDPDMRWSHPGELLKEVYADEFERHYWDSIPHVDTAGNIWWEHKFYYMVKLRDEDRFLQRKGEIYWLDIGAQMADGGDSFQWGWETSKDHWNDAAVSGDGYRWEPLAHPEQADFEDLPLNNVYTVGQSFSTGLLSIVVEPFRYHDGTQDLNGNASVTATGCAGGSGQEIRLSTVNLAFEFPCETNQLQMDVGYQGGILNLDINGEKKVFDNLNDINVQIIGGVLFLFDDPDGDGKGKLSLKGPIYNLSLGGQELCIDNIEYVCKHLDMAFALITQDDTAYCEGDFDRDGDVDGKDMAVFIEDFNRTDCHDSGDCEGDFNYDGSVKDDDIMVFAPDYGRQDCLCTIPVDCDDNDSCTFDFIDPATMQCTHRQICEACCLADAMCDNLPIDECVSQGGNPMGQGTNCTTTQCSSAVEHDEGITFPVNGLVLYAPSIGAETISLSGPMAMDVYFEGPEEGDAQDDDDNGLDEVRTRVLSLDLHGIDPVLGPVSLKLNHAFDSTGGIEETENLLVGRLDVPPFGPAGSVADSFFDIFVEIETGGQKRHSNTPLRFAGTITYKPLEDKDVFWCVSTEPVELFNEAGISTGETLGCIEPMGACCIAGRCIALARSECVARGGDYKGPGTECAIGLCE